MASKSLLSVDREEYWRNRLLKKCFGCSTELRSDQFKGVVYRNEVCGHQVCSRCLVTTYLTRSSHNCFCRNSFSGFAKFVPTTLESDLQAYSNELLTAAQGSFATSEAALKAAAQAELKLIVEEKDREQAGLKLTVEEKNREQAELKKENATLRTELETVRNAMKAEEEKTQETIDIHCTECGYGVIFEKCRICVSCGIESGYIVEQKTDEGKNVFEVASFDKAEISLLCASCVLDGAHENHHVVNYFKQKTTQLSASHSNEINLRLNSTFDEGWNAVCQKTNQCHFPIVEILTKRDEKKMKQDSWEDFRKTQLKESSIVQRMTESKTNMVGHMHKYTGDMKVLLMEAQTVLQAAQQSRKRAHSASGVEE